MSGRIRDSLGPSIIITAALVGTGELIIAPRLGASVGMSALWIVVVGCVVKVLIQEEFGRHTILTGDSTLEALNRVPGPAWRLSWLAWSWTLVLVAGTVQLGGILATLVQTARLLHVPGQVWLLAALIVAGTTLLLAVGRYQFIERTSAILVAGFTAMTVIALVLLQRTEFQLSFGQLLDGLKFRMPESGFADAVAVFGITGIGTSELLFYSYWCLEKGYAKDLKAGEARDTAMLAGRVRGMRVDIAIALVIYTFATIAFFVLGATILHGMQEVPRGLDLIGTLSQMYTRTFGEWVYYLFVVGAFVVLFSTFFVAMATWARLCADNIRLIAGPKANLDQRRVMRWTLVTLGVIYLALCLGFNQTPQWLIVGGGAVQTIMLPTLGIGVLIIRRRRNDPFRPGKWFDVALYLSVAIITAAALYSIWGLLMK